MTLTATPEAGSTFSGWSGACTGGSCSVIMDTAKSVTATFTCPTPATPSNPSPSNGATGIPTNQTLGWAISSNAASYDVYFGTSTNPLFVGNVVSTSYVPSGLNPNTIYYWKIVARNGCGNSAQGPMWNFTTVVAVPLPPILSSPGKGDTGVPLSPILTWHTSNGTDTYHLMVSTDPDFSTTIVDEPALTSTSYTVTGPLPVETIFYWQVSATGGGGTSAWSEVWNFKTQPNYVPPFSDLKGISDPPNDNDGDGIDDSWEKANLSDISPQYKTLFVRPKKTSNILGSVYNYWEGFVNLFPDTRAGRYGFADIPAFTNAGIEILVIGKSCCSDPNNPGTCNYYDASKQQCHKYEPFDHFDYDPSSDPNHPSCDILEITYVEANADFPYCYNCIPNYQGHTFFSTSAKQWSWDTKGYTPSTQGPWGYKTPEDICYRP